MEVDEIIKQVRFCIDEESNNSSSIADVVDEKDDFYMDNIIKAKIPDALHWIAITANSSSTLSTSSSAIKGSDKTDTSTSAEIKVSKFEQSESVGLVEMPSNITVFNITRVRGYGWHKAVAPVEDTDDEALCMFDDTAMGTIDRPLAAIMRTTPLQILIQPIPSSNTVTVSYVGVPTGTTKDSDGKENVDLSDNFKSSFIYYLAFLLLSAYDDSKATQMYNIALQMLGASQTK